MKALVVYYSRTNTTKKVGDEIAKKLKADIMEIKSKTDYAGALGYLRAGREAMKKILPDIAVSLKDPSKYDLVIIGTPIWGWTMSSPVRSFIMKNKDQLKNVAFFATMGGSGDEKAFMAMEEMTSKPNATIGLLTKDVHKGNYDLKEFITQLK